MIKKIFYLVIISLITAIIFVLLVPFGTGLAFFSIPIVLYIFHKLNNYPEKIISKIFRYIKPKPIKLANLISRLKIILRKPISSKQNFQISLLILILLVLISPYLLKAYNTYLENIKIAKVIEKQFKEAERERIIKKKQTALLRKYGINSLEYNNYLVEPGVYGIPDEVYEYLETKKDIITNEHKFTCENPPRIEDYNAPASSYFPQTDVYFRQFDIDSFLRECKRLEARKSAYNNFEKDAENIKKLIDENKSSNDFDIKKMVERLNIDYSKYLFLKQDLNEEVKTPEVNSKELEEYYQTYKNPYVIYLRKVLNAYLSNNMSKVNIAINALKKTSDENFIRGLEGFDKEYYKSKFVVITFTKHKAGGVELRIMFQDKPDRIFDAWIYRFADGDFELRGFVSDENYDPVKIKELNNTYKQFLLDKKHAI